MSKYSNEINQYIMELENSFKRTLELLLAVWEKPDYINLTKEMFDSIVFPKEFLEYMPQSLKDRTPNLK